MTQSTNSEITAPLAGTPEQLTANKMAMDNILMLAMLFAIFYFILIRPQQKRIKTHKEMLGGLEKGNRVITQGGLIGTIIKFEGDNVVVIEVAQGVKVRVAKSAISEVTTDKVGSDSANDN
jgi:preprotein translocase subunit YajC